MLHTEKSQIEKSGLKRLGNLGNTLATRRAFPASLQSYGRGKLKPRGTYIGSLQPPSPVPPPLLDHSDELISIDIDWPGNNAYHCNFSL